MRLSFLPRDMVFFQLLENLASTAEKAVKLFRVLVQEWNLQHPAIVGLRDLEHECDLIVHEIMVKLNKTFVTPIDREDIHLLSKKIDDLVDYIHALSERMLLFQIESVRGELIEMADVLEQAMGVAVSAIHKIRDLKDTEAIYEECIQIHTLENQGDRLFERALGALFQKNAEPLEVIKWKEIYDFLERAIDACEDIADIIWGIVVKYG